MAEHMLPHVARALDQLVPAWEPPAELGGGAAADGVSTALVQAVAAALTPLHQPPGAPESEEHAPLPLPVAPSSFDERM